MFIGLHALMAGVQTVHEQPHHEVNLLELREKRPIEPDRSVELVRALLDMRRLWPHPVSLMQREDDFVVAGMAASQLYEVCESLWRRSREVGSPGGERSDEERNFRIKSVQSIGIELRSRIP
jgi:hypothetical protein